jgi:hydrogenase maturation protease
VPLLVIGIGNSGRQDDGLGWEFLDRVQAAGALPARFEYCYQLQVEDAVLISTAERVVFVDSFRGRLPHGFLWKECEARSEVEFTSHVLPPQEVVFLCQRLYASKPEAYVLQIQGESWELATGLSDAARNNLEAALDFFRAHVCSERW